MDILGENASMFLWKYGGMTSAAVGTLSVLTLVVINALTDSGSGQGYERRHDDENANRQTVGSYDHRCTNNSSNDIKVNKETNVNGVVNNGTDDDCDDHDDKERKENNKHQHHHYVDESLLADASKENRRRSKKKYFAK